MVMWPCKLAIDCYVHTLTVCTEASRTLTSTYGGNDGAQVMVSATAGIRLRAFGDRRNAQLNGSWL